jgi:hypothetical protein
MNGNKMAAACSMHKSDEKYVQNLLKNLKGRDYSKNLGVHDRILLRWAVSLQ